MASINIVDFIAKLVLEATRQPIVIILFTIGLIGIDRNRFGKALFIFLFSIITNIWLKSLWQIPLPLPLEGWAFPSGHMQNTFVLWGYLAHTFKKRVLTLSITCFLLLIGFSLIHCQYHHLIDIVGSFVFGTLLLITYNYFLKIPMIEKYPNAIGLVLAILALPMIYSLPHYPDAVFMIEGTLVGLSIGLFLQSYKETNFKVHDKIVLCLITLGGIYCLKKYMVYNWQSLNARSLLFCQYNLIGLWINGLAPKLYQYLKK